MIIFLALQLIILRRAQAEYRVYRLGVKLTDKSPEQEVLTTLDDIQYLTYYKASATTQVRLIQHWMCRGRTDEFKRYCPGPVLKTASATTAQGPAPIAAP